MVESGVAPEASASQPLPRRNEQDDQDDNGKKTNVRKRTKTGCLTCRKRRIKCDEARPTCNNCIKSKRQCEGYSQRVVFKDPMGAMHGGPYGPISYPVGASHLAGQLQGRPSSQGPLPMIAPKPPSLEAQQDFRYAQHSHEQMQHAPYPYNLSESSSLQGHFAPSEPLASPGLPPDYAHNAHDSRQPSLVQVTPEQHSDTSPTTTQQRPTELSNDDQNELIRRQVVAWEKEIPEDDADMPDSDDETRDPRQYMGPIVQKFSAVWDANGTRVRTFNMFAQCDILSEYNANARMSELKDPRMLAIFMHFIKVTGPSMSLYERHPFDHGDEDQFQPNPTNGKNIWSYTFPVISFNHPGLLHAMLALASLQIAKLQGVPATAAMKHYHLAIRRVAKNVKSPRRRMQPATLAATLLLSYFEVWQSDHSKWCNHLFGARILFREIPLRWMSRHCLPAKRRRLRQKDAEELLQMNTYYAGFKFVPKSQLFDLNYSLLTALSGQLVTPDDHGLDNESDHETPGSASDKDIDDYENLRDLYWWYCKMDVYQSMLGGTALFMEYDHWNQCPPRAGISKLEAIYGTYDHLMLLLGRLASFSSKDVSRKREVERSRGSQAGPNSPPQFPGIVPRTGKVKPPMGFSPPRESSPQSDGDEDSDPDAKLQAALAEWEAIRQGFDMFREALGQEFQPLRPEYSDHRDSPFGQPLQYRTFGVAGIWMNFYMGMIHLHRTHPMMPSAAMQAAGAAARQTAQYAETMGRIGVGLSEDNADDGEISTLVSAAFIESCFCLFVAAVQFQDNDQRQWMVRRMYKVTRLTGWQSARQIADGCESGWIKAAQLGRGPPYHRPDGLGPEIPTDVWLNPRRLDRRILELDPNTDNRLPLAKSEQAYYAMGIIGVEEDMARLVLKDKG